MTRRIVMNRDKEPRPKDPRRPGQVWWWIIAEDDKSTGDPLNHGWEWKKDEAYREAVKRLRAMQAQDVAEAM